MKKFLACLFVVTAGSVHAHNPHHHHNHHNRHNWQPFVAGVVLGAVLTRPGVVYSQQVPVTPYYAQPSYSYPPVVNYSPRPYYNSAPNCRYAEARDYYGNIVSFLQCN